MHIKRLIESNLPIASVSEQAVREKSIRKGHISTLHLWWARRPLASCRAVICATLWPDPADPKCPKKYRQDVAFHLNEWYGKCASHLTEKTIQFFIKIGSEVSAEKPMDLKEGLICFISEFSRWESSSSKSFIETAQALTHCASYALNQNKKSDPPIILDPFAGGGAIPLEGLRVGAQTISSDLNPVAVLLNEAMQIDIPRHGRKLSESVRKWGTWMLRELEQRVGSYYGEPNESCYPAAYIWARQIKCEGPSCGQSIPLVRSGVLSKNRGEVVYLKPVVTHGTLDLELVKGRTSAGALETVKRGNATCPVCGFTTPVESVRKQLKQSSGGANDSLLIAVVEAYHNETGKNYRLANKDDRETYSNSSAYLDEMIVSQGLGHMVPMEGIPLMSGVFNVPIYGHDTWSSLFNKRQLLALINLSMLVQELSEAMRGEDPNLILSVQKLLAFAVDRQADYCSALARWHNSRAIIGSTFGRQALPMVWDYAEVNVLSKSSGGFAGAIEWVANVCEHNADLFSAGTVLQASASNHPLPDDSVDYVVTDPPYYNAVPYADLSDFFYVWLKRSLANSADSKFEMQLSPKDEEICQMSGWDPDRYGHKSSEWYEQKMREALIEARRILRPNGICVVVFAHKSTLGWESMLKAMVDAGWVITASWPIATEMAARMRAQNSAVLASSVHLVCRPRTDQDEAAPTDNIGNWGDVLAELPKRIHDWMPHLAKEGIVGADAIFACLGPALEIYSRYSSVEKASGEKVDLKEYMQHIWAAVSKEALSMLFEDADASGFEEDARLTAMWLWTLAAQVGGDDDGEESSGKEVAATFGLEYDTARKIAQGLGAHLEDLHSIVEIKGANSRLLSVAERTAHLFGKDGIESQIASKKKSSQIDWLTELSESSEQSDYQFDEATVTQVGKTTLDRVHQSMILFAAGRGDAMKRFLVEDGVGQSPSFWKLGQALSALYPTGTQEKRWVDGVLARKKGLGL